MKRDWNVNDKWSKFSIHLEQYRKESLFLRHEGQRYARQLKEVPYKSFASSENKREMIDMNKLYKEAKIHLIWCKLHSF